MGQITRRRTVLTAPAFRPERREEVMEASWEILFSSHRIPGPTFHLVQSSVGKIIYIYVKKYIHTHTLARCLYCVNGTGQFSRAIGKTSYHYWLPFAPVVLSDKYCSFFYTVSYLFCFAFVFCIS